MNKAFTLIELLVVVLIIGILSAVALPQYQKAVEKARLTEAFIGLKALATASDIYFLANNTRPYDFTVLDIDFPVKEYRTYDGKENAEILVQNGADYYLDVDGYMAARPKNIFVQLEYVWDSQQYRCRVFVGKDTKSSGHDLCKSLGGVFLTEGSGSTFYLLP